MHFKINVVSIRHFNLIPMTKVNISLKSISLILNQINFLKFISLNILKLKCYLNEMMACCTINLKKKLLYQHYWLIYHVYFSPGKCFAQLHWKKCSFWNYIWKTSHSISEYFTFDFYFTVAILEMRQMCSDLNEIRQDLPVIPDLIPLPVSSLSRSCIFTLLICFFDLGESSAIATSPPVVLFGVPHSCS